MKILWDFLDVNYYSHLGSLLKHQIPGLRPGKFGLSSLWVLKICIFTNVSGDFDVACLSIWEILDYCMGNLVFFLPSSIGSKLVYLSLDIICIYHRKFEKFRKNNEVKKLPPFFSVLIVYIILCFVSLIRHYVLIIFQRNKLWETLSLNIWEFPEKISIFNFLNSSFLPRLLIFRCYPHSIWLTALF